MIRKFLKVPASLLIAAFFIRFAVEIFKDGHYLYSIVIVLLSLFGGLMAYFTIEGNRGEE